MNAEVFVAILALLVSVASFAFAWRVSRRAARAEEVKTLLGEKESVGFGALKLLREGLPGEHEVSGFWSRTVLRSRRHRERRRREDSKQRELIVGALIAACVFESSDRARALLFRVIEKYRCTRFRSDFDRQYAEFKTSVDSTVKYGFTKGEFDPENPKVRLEAIRKVLEHEDTAATGIE
jgi:hypothetical protein